MNYRRNPDSVKTIIDLYTKIPDYSELKHLGNSAFINKIEKLKEEFREIRSSLCEDSDDVEWLSESTKNALHISPRTKKPEVSLRTEAQNISNRGIGGAPYNHMEVYDTKSYNLAVNGRGMYPNPINVRGPCAGRKYYLPLRTDLPNTSSSSFSQSNLVPLTKNEWRSSFDDVEVNGQDTDDGGKFSVTASLSQWSTSSPEISLFRKRKEYVPPQNIEDRLSQKRLQRKSLDMSQSAASVLETGDSKPPRHHLVPASVSKPLFHQIMDRNRKRSERVREQSKQRLMAQVKPFSFSKPSGKSCGTVSKAGIPLSEPSGLLNNSKTLKSRKQRNSLKVQKNVLENQMFKASPAPPRRRALMAALRLKEQQDYRELKKQMRAEALMKMASLPPGMAARDRNRVKPHTTESLGTLLQKNVGKQARKERNIPDSDATSTCTDEDFVFDKSEVSDRSDPGNDDIRSWEKSKSQNSKRNHKSFLSGLANGMKNSYSLAVFESTSNDNIASKLRIAAVRRKEQERIRREQQENSKLRKMEEKRYELKSAHSDVWKRACSYSCKQDIAVRRELRIAAAILERDSFQKDMSNMLSRVRSAPLLLEGVRERRYEPCKKHRQEMQESGRMSNQANKSSKYFNKSNLTLENDRPGTQCDGNSETLAMAEGTLTNSDNESVNEIQLESEDEEKEATYTVEDEAAVIEREADEIIENNNE